MRHSPKSWPEQRWNGPTPCSECKAARRWLKLTEVSATILGRRLSSPGPLIFPSPRDPQKHRGPAWRVHAEVLEVLAATLVRSNLRRMRYVHLTGDHIDEEMLRIEQLRLKRTIAEQTPFFAGLLPEQPRETAKQQGRTGNWADARTAPK